jgi:hypothetical protein
VGFRVWRELGREVAFFMVFVCFLLVFFVGRVEVHKIPHHTTTKFMYELCLLVDLWWLLIERGLRKSGELGWGT